MPVSSLTKDKIQNLLREATSPKQKKIYEEMLSKMEQKKIIIKKPETKKEKPKQHDCTSGGNLRVPYPQEYPLGHAQYHGVGVFNTQVNFDDEGKGNIILDNNNYSLFGTINHKVAIKQLKKRIEKTGIDKQTLIVYPKILHLPDRKISHQISFSLIAFEGEKKPEEPLTSWLGDREFRLSGIWQFISCCKCPVITVKRNFSREALEDYKAMDEPIKTIYAKASHIPLYWKDAPVLPFKHDRNKEEQMPAYFVDIKAVFLPKQNAFGFRKLLSEPILKYPKSINPPAKKR